MNVLVTDDHELFRRGTANILVKNFPDVNIFEASTGQEAIETVRTQKLDAVILDVNLPDKNGIEVLEEIKSFKPHIPVIVLSLHPSERYGIRVLKADGAAYLTKDCEPEELCQCLRIVLAGRKYVIPALAEQLADALHPQKPPLYHQNLSNQELEVLRLIFAGMMLGDIAKKLVVSVKTVGAHRSRLLEKLQVQTTADLIRYAIEYQLFD